MENAAGRSDDMLIIRGVNLFPSQIETVLLDMNETKTHYLLIIDRLNNLDTLELQVEVEDRFFQTESANWKIYEKKFRIMLKAQQE